MKVGISAKLQGAKSRKAGAKGVQWRQKYWLVRGHIGQNPGHASEADPLVSHNATARRRRSRVRQTKVVSAVKSRQSIAV